MPSSSWVQRAWNWTSNLLRPSGVGRLQPQVDAINQLEPTIKALSDEALQQKTQDFKARLDKGASLDDLLPEAFAVVREASWRVLGMRHYDVQLLGGMTLHKGSVAEMRTGEGKTLAATLPAYLNALTGDGVHVITVNDYLASRDAEWMGKIYRFLGLEVGCVLEDMGRDEEQENRLRREAYAADITYGTNSTMVFDYLKDNLITSPDQRVHRGQAFAIVDEVDLLLIDEVRTPLIISGPSREDSSRFVKVDKVIRRLQSGVHYRADWKTKTASLTEVGWEKAEKDLGVGALNHPDNLQWYNAVYQSVLAHCIFRKDVDYIVAKGSVQLIDEHTGRVSEDKRFSDGLHQALEAKEGLRVQPEDRTFARISYQGYFRLYDKLSGMTGTATGEKEEFAQTYGMGVIKIPTNRTMQRKDYKDSIFATMEDKHEIIANEVAELQEEGRPVLIGTCNVRESEQLARVFKKRKIRCQVLNAKNHEREAEIIAQAGRLNTVTISTNMAGRGTDILLGGDPEKLAHKKTKAKPGSAAFEKVLDQTKAACEEEAAQVREAGGLHVIGTSLHEAARLDDQLRGRAGRQGDPGSSQFLICLEDEIFRRYGEAEVEMMLDEYDRGEAEEIVDASVVRRLQHLRQKVGVEHKYERTETFKYDQVIDIQRQEIYAWRNQLLDASQSAEEARGNAHQVIARAIDDLLTEFTDDPEFVHSDEEQEQLEDALANLFAYDDLEVPSFAESPDNLDKIPEAVLEQVIELRDARAKKVGADVMTHFEYELLLQIIDELWIDHLTAIEHLEDRVNLMSYAQLDPLVLFKTEVAKMFQQLLAQIHKRAVNLWYTLEVVPTKKKERRSRSPRKKRNKR